MGKHRVNTDKNAFAPNSLRWAYKLRGHLVCVPLLVAIFCAWNEYENHLTAWIAGGVVFGLGLLIRIWAQQHLRFRLTKNTVLTRTGPYALIRNPIYVGNTLICLGLVAASGLMWLVPITLLVCIVTYHHVVGYEEKKLTKIYGKPYLEYMSDVPRWMPKMRPGYRPEWITNQLRPSLLAEAYNLLLLVPFILKEMFLA